jgi:hypothetical protein
MAAAAALLRSGCQKRSGCGWSFRPLAATVGPGRAVGPMASTEMKKAENSYSTRGDRSRAKIDWKRVAKYLCFRRRRALFLRIIILDPTVAQHIAVRSFHHRNILQKHPCQPNRRSLMEAGRRLTNRRWSHPFSQ